MDTLKPGDEVEHIMLLNTLSGLTGLFDTHIRAEKHKVRMVVHEKGVMVEHQGRSHLVFDSNIAYATKAKAPEAPKPEAPEAKRGPGRPPKAPEAA